MSNPANAAAKEFLTVIAKNPVIRIIATIFLLFMGPIGWMFIVVIWLIALIG